MGASGRVARIAITAFLTDFSLYLLWVAIPYKAIALGGGAAYLGILPAISSTTYVLVTVAAGRLSDRVSRLKLSRFGAFAFVVAALCVMQARSLFSLAALLPLVGFSVGFFWAPLQAALADEDSPSRLEPNIGLFNVSWSIGKGMGFLLGGSLYARFGAGPSFLAAAAAMLIVAAVLPAPRRHEHTEDEGPSQLLEIPPTRVRAFLVMAWLANAVAFGVANTLNLHYPKYLLQLGRGPAVFGLFLGSVFVVQAVTMAVLRHAGGWKFRRAPSFSVQIALAAGLFAIPLLGAAKVVFLAAIPVGIALGFAYHASITYSLIDRAARGRQAGMHESILGTGSFLLPLLGGIFATATHDLRTPFWFCSAIVVVILAVQQAIWARGQRAHR